MSDLQDAIDVLTSVRAEIARLPEADRAAVNKAADSIRALIYGRDHGVHARVAALSLVGAESSVIAEFHEADPQHAGAAWEAAREALGPFDRWMTHGGAASEPSPG